MTVLNHHEEERTALGLPAETYMTILLVSKSERRLIVLRNGANQSGLQAVLASTITKPGALTRTNNAT